MMKILNTLQITKIIKRLRLLYLMVKMGLNKVAIQKEKANH